jgi:hypothetical protein
MTPKVAPALLFATLMVLPLSTRACAVGFKPETSGFALNPTLKKLTVTSSKLEKTGDVCLLHVNDEILQVNSQLVPGQSATTPRKCKRRPGVRPDNLFKPKPLRGLA